MSVNVEASSEGIEFGAQTKSEEKAPPSANLHFSGATLNRGFNFGLLLALLSFLAAAVYLFVYLSTTASVKYDLAIHSDLDMAAASLMITERLSLSRIMLQSCGMCIGFSLAFLGFTLSLTGLRAEMEAEAKSEGARVKLARVSPGVFVIFCGAILAGYCGTKEQKVQVDTPTVSTLSHEKSEDDTLWKGHPVIVVPEGNGDTKYKGPKKSGHNLDDLSTMFEVSPSFQHFTLLKPPKNDASSGASW